MLIRLNPAIGRAESHRGRAYPAPNAPAADLPPGRGSVRVPRSMNNGAMRNGPPSAFRTVTTARVEMDEERISGLH